jgi:hypothetical protein
MILSQPGSIRIDHIQRRELITLLAGEQPQQQILNIVSAVPRLLTRSARDWLPPLLTPITFSNNYHPGRPRQIRYVGIGEHPAPVGQLEAL